MTAIIAVSLAIIGLVLVWLLFGNPPRLFAYLFCGAVLALLSCGIYSVLVSVGM